METVLLIGAALFAVLLIIRVSRTSSNDEELLEDAGYDHDKANELADQIRSIADSLGLTDDQKNDLEIDMASDIRFATISNLQTTVRLLPQIGSRKFSAYDVPGTCNLLGMLDSEEKYITVDDLTPDHVELNGFLNEQVFETYKTKDEKKVHTGALNAFLSLNEYPQILHAMRDRGITDPEEAIAAAKSLSESGATALSEGAL